MLEQLNVITIQKLRKLTVQVLYTDMQVQWALAHHLQESLRARVCRGHMGAEKVTVQNLEIVKIDAENNLIAIKGAIPGPKNGTVTIVDCIKKA